MTLSLTIDNQRVTACEGDSLLDVALAAGADIPHLCHEPMITPYGACRLCLVQVTRGGRTKITTACNYEVLDGIDVHTNTEDVRRHRRMVLELLLGMAPGAERVVELAESYGIDTPRFAAKEPPAGRERCILCGLCSRVCDEVVGASAITFSGRGNTRGLVVPFGERISDACIGCGACAAVCPTDAIDMESIAVATLRQRPAAERPCRYASMGLMPGAVCPNDYECARCEVDQRFTELCHPHHPIFLARGKLVLPGWEL